MLLFLESRPCYNRTKMQLAANQENEKGWDRMMKKEKNGKLCFRPAKAAALTVMFLFFMFSITGFSSLSETADKEAVMLITLLSLAAGVIFYFLISELYKITIDGDEIRIRRLFLWKKRYHMGDVERAVHKMSGPSTTLYFRDGKKAHRLSGGADQYRRLIDSLQSAGIAVTTRDGFDVPRSVKIEGKVTGAEEAKEFSFRAAEEIERELREVREAYGREGCELVTGMLERTNRLKQEGWSFVIRFKTEGRYLTIGAGQCAQIICVLAARNRKKEMECFTNYMELYTDYWRVVLYNTRKELKLQKKLRLMDGEPLEGLIPLPAERA